LSLTDLASADVLSIQFSRIATNALDTIENTVYLKGFIVGYTSEKIK
jgi:hypothetical protein